MAVQPERRNHLLECTSFAEYMLGYFIKSQ
jgi:hypothetical protein